MSSGLSWDFALLWLWIRLLSPACVCTVPGVSQLSGRRPAACESKMINQLTSQSNEQGSSTGACLGGFWSPLWAPPRGAADLGEETACEEFKSLNDNLSFGDVAGQLVRMQCWVSRNCCFQTQAPASILVVSGGQRPALFSGRRPSVRKQVTVVVWVRGMFVEVTNISDLV